MSDSNSQDLSSPKNMPNLGIFNFILRPLIQRIQEKRFKQLSDLEPKTGNPNPLSGTSTGADSG